MSYDGTSPEFASNERELEFLGTSTKFVLSLSSEDDKEQTWNMREFDIRGDAHASLFELFWEYCRSASELGNGVGTHHRRHAGEDAEITNNVSGFWRLI